MRYHNKAFILLEFYEDILMRLGVDKQAELLQKIKRPFRHDHEKTIAEIRKDAKNLQEVDEKFKNSDRARIINVNISEDGSPRLYLSNHPEPTRIYPDAQTVNAVSQYKKFVPALLKSFNKQGWIGRLITILALKNNFSVLEDYFKFAFEAHQLLLKPEHYSPIGKELRRVLIKKPSYTMEALVLILEYDMAYRYRFQDIIVNYDRSKGVRKELCRLLDLLASREKTDYQAMKLKWKRIKQILNIILFISPKLRKQIKEIMDEFRLDEFKFSKEDLYWVNNNGTYVYRGIPLAERRAENKLKYNL